MDFFNAIVSLCNLAISAGTLYVAWVLTNKVSVISRIEDQIIQQSISQIESVEKYEQFIIESLGRGVSMSSMNLVFSRMNSTYNRANLLLASSEDHQMTGRDLEEIRKQYIKCKYLCTESSPEILSFKYPGTPDFGGLLIEDSIITGDSDRTTLVEFELRGLHTLWLQCCLSPISK